jgi:diguanylate cyclase (GGDEF)-like protein
MSPLLPLVFLAVTVSAYFFSPRRTAVGLACAVAVCASPFAYAAADTLGGYVVRFVALATTATVLAVILAYNKRQLVAAQQTSDDLAEHDALTGLPNRRAFFSRLTERLGDAHEESRQLAVAIIDLDNFKAVNDGHGHATGDAVLRAIAGALRDVVRCDDCLARIGGDEFALLASDAESDLTRTLGLRCIEAVQAAAIAAGSGDCGVSATVGFATFPEHAADPDGLVAVADKALMDAKTAGKQRVAAPEWTAALAS